MQNDKWSTLIGWLFFVGQNFYTSHIIKTVPYKSCHLSLSDIAINYALWYNK